MYAAESKTPTSKCLFLPRDSTSAAVINKKPVICPRDQTEPVLDKNQNILPIPIRRPDQIDSILSLFTLNDKVITRITDIAPKICARYCCGKLLPKKRTGGMARIAGIGGFTKKNFPSCQGISSLNHDGFSVSQYLPFKNACARRVK